MDNRKISLCIPTYNRVDVLIESFSKVISDERVSDIFISDDASDIEIFQQVRSIVEVLNQTHGNKITMSRNLSNQDCYFNKRTAVMGAKQPFCILLDSDNVIDTDYLDRLFEIAEWDASTIYTPEYAMPNFDFRAYAGLLITKKNVGEWIDKPMFETCLNAANYFVNKDNYLHNWDGSVNPVTSDSIFVCYNWLKSGKKIKIVQGLQYFHRVHSGSHYQNNVKRTPPGFHQSVLDKIKQLQ